MPRFSKASRAGGSRIQVTKSPYYDNTEHQDNVGSGSVKQVSKREVTEHGRFVAYL